MPRKTIINCHCHLLNFKFVPDRMTKLLSHIPEDIADDEWFACAAGVITALIPGRTYDRIKKYLKAYRSSIDDVTDLYIKELDHAGIDICTPLMMDLKQSVSGTEPDDILYPDQIDLISEQVLKYPWRIFPFVMFDPRRDGSDDLVITALKDKGFLGVKMYPALGYHPSPRVMKNPGPMWKEIVKPDPQASQRLEIVYEYCRENKIPITAHASIGGAYSEYRKEKDRQEVAWPLTEVSNWIDPLHDYNLKINLAHFGGNYLHTNREKQLQSINWRRQILNLMARSSANGSGSVFTDISYHDMAHDKGTQDRYFTDLNMLLDLPEYQDRILYGSDASMISHTWSEKEFIAPFKKNVKPQGQNRLFSDNAARFLFEDTQIPDRYINFLKEHNQGNVPSTESAPWITIKSNDSYHIMTNSG